MEAEAAVIKAVILVALVLWVLAAVATLRYRELQHELDRIFARAEVMPAQRPLRPWWKPASGEGTWPYPDEGEVNG